MDKESLIKALKGGGRTQVDPSIGQVQLTPTLGRYGNYNVVTEPTSKNNSATQLSRALMAAPQLVGQFKNIQEAAGIREANELTTKELETRFNKGDMEADGILSQLFKDQAFQQQVYTRKFDSEVTPGIRKAKAAIKNRNVEELAGMSDEGYAAFVQKELTDTLGPDFLAMVKSKPHIARIHNRAMERVIPHTVEELVAWKNKEVTKYTKVMGLSNAANVAGLGLPHTAVRVGSVGAIAPNLVGLVKEIEAGGEKDKFHPEAYWDYGQWSIGYGTKSHKGETITKEEASKRLDKELAGAAEHVNKYNKIYNWKPHELDALTSFAYNVGNINELTADGTRSRAVIAAKMLEYNKATEKGKKVKLEGLVKRRKIEQDLFLNGYSGEEGEELAPEDAEYEAKDIPVAGKLAHLSQEITGSITRQVERLAGLDGTNHVERMNALADNLVNAVVSKYDQDGDLETLDAWLQLAEDGKELFIDGKPYAATEQGRSVVRRVRAFVEQEEANRERGRNRIGGDASERESLELIYKAKKAMADAAAAVRDGKDPAEHIAIFDEVYAAATDLENKGLYFEHRVKVLDVLTAVREQADRYPIGQSIDDEQDYQVWETSRNLTATFTAGSKADNRYAGLPLLLKGIGYDIGDYKVEDPTETGPPITNPKIFTLADTASSKARDGVIAELIGLNEEEYAAAIEQKSAEDRYKEAFEKHMEPLMLNEFGAPDEPPTGVTREKMAAARAQELQAEQGDTDLVDFNGKLQRYDGTADGVDRALRTFMDEATYDIVRETTTPSEIRRLAMLVSSDLFGHKAFHQKIGEALAAGPKSAVETHVKLFEGMKKIGIPMHIHRNGGLFEFSSEYIATLPVPNAPGFYTSKRHRDHSIDFNAPTKQFPKGRFNDIRTSKDSIYNIEAIRWYVKNNGDDYKLRDLAKIYGLDPEEFITNQVELAEKFKLIDPQPKPE